MAKISKEKTTKKDPKSQKKVQGKSVDKVTKKPAIKKQKKKLSAVKKIKKTALIKKPTRIKKPIPKKVPEKTIETLPVKIPHKEPSIVVPPVVVKQPTQEPLPVVKPKPVLEEKLPKVKINELTTVRELSEKISISPQELLKKLLFLGVVASINQHLESDTISLLVHEFGYEAEFVPLYSEESIEIEKEDTTKLIPRAPVVTIMGHVDHGKTTLLDTIRKSKITEKEYGGITQHIGAYKVKTPKGEIVFLDTPGHEAFTAMRAHGAKITDIVVVVVAADDAVMPQTIEAIDHARASNVPIIVAINKIDLPNSNSQRVKQQLSEYKLIPDDWGGDTLTVETSARNNINIDKLLEAILFKAELMELKANPNRPAQGVIIEAQISSQRGSVATTLIQNGRLNCGDAFICGLSYGKVRAIIDEFGERVKSAGPSTPVEVLGFNTLPHSGDKFVVVKDEKIAKEIIERRVNIVRRERMIAPKRITLEDLATTKIKQLNVILKTDVLGSLQVLRDTLERLDLEGIKINIVHYGVGAISESDVNLAIVSSAIIIGFNVKPVNTAEILAKNEKVEIRIYRIIYELIDDIKKSLRGMLEPKIKETVIGRVEVKETFQISRFGTVAGCVVTDGKVQRNAKIRLLRDNVIVHEGNISSLKRFKEDVREVEKGYECGVLIENYNDIKIGDVLEFSIQEKIHSE